MPEPEVEAQFAALTRDYAQRLPGRVRGLEAEAAALAEAWDRARADELQRQCHNLAGSGACYGFPQVSTAAQAAEREVEACLALGASTPALAGALVALVAAVDATVGGA